MNNWRAALVRWRQDAALGRVIRNSAHLFSNNSISLGIGILQGALILRLLGPAGVGLLTVIMGYASTVNSLFSFRMSELVVRYGGEYLETGDRARASAVIRAAGLAEALVSALAFILVALTAGWASQTIAKTPGTAWMFIVYAIGLLANFNVETSTGVLQITDRIRLQGIVNLIQSAITFSIILGAFLLQGTLEIVLLAYIISRSLLGLGMFFAAQRQLRRVLGIGWWRQPLSALGPPRELFRFAVSSNISATIIRVFRESEPLWVGYFLTTTAVGYYRVAYTIVGFLSFPADPLIATSFPEINRLVSQKAWPRLKDFLRRITSFALSYNLALALGLVIFGRWVIRIYSGEQYLPAYPALVALLVGLAFNYTLFWNRPLLLSLGLPGYPIKATLIVGLIKVGLAFLVVPRYGFVAEAALLSFYYLASVGAMAWRGIREINGREAVA